jgi:hypothetical protein
MAAILDQAWLQGKIEKSEPKILFCPPHVNPHVKNSVLPRYARQQLKYIMKTNFHFYVSTRSQVVLE